MSDKMQDEILLKDIILKIKDWVYYIRKQWLKILLAGLIGGVSGILYAITIKPKYKAVVSFALEDDKSSGGGLTGALGLASQFGIDLGSNAGGAFNGPNLVEFMKSRAMVEKALLQPMPNMPERSLADYFMEFTGMKKGLQKEPILSKVKFSPSDDRSNFSLQQDSVLGIIYSNLSKEMLNIAPRDKKLSIIDVSVVTVDEIFSKYFVEILTQVVSQFYIDSKTKKQVSNLKILQHQYDSVRYALNEAISGVATATDNTFSLNPGLAVKRTPSQRRQVDVQVNTAVLTELIKNLEIAKVTLRKETPLIQIIDSPILPLQKERLGKAKSGIIGGLLGVFLIIGVHVLRKWWSEISGKLYRKSISSEFAGLK